MAFIVIIRGPAGVGKSTIAKLLSSDLGAEYIAYDPVMRENKLDAIEGDGISEQNFLKANELLIPKIISDAMRGKNVVLDGCFYRKRQLEHLSSHLPTPPIVFSLEAPLSECLARNRSREDPLPDEAVRAVFKLVAATPLGQRISTAGKAPAEIAAELRARLSRR